MYFLATGCCCCCYGSSPALRGPRTCLPTAGPAPRDHHGSRLLDVRRALFIRVEAVQAPRGVGMCRGGGVSPWTPLHVPAPLGVTPRVPSQCRRIVSLSRDGTQGEAGGGGDGWGRRWHHKVPTLPSSDLWPLRRCIGPEGFRLSIYAGLTI